MPRRMLVAMQMEEFMTRRYELRFNRMKGCKEYRERHSLFTDYRPVTAEAVSLGSSSTLTASEPSTNSRT